METVPSGMWWCCLCSLPSANERASHFQSAKHQTVAASWSGVRCDLEGRVLRCCACRVTFTSRFNLEQHLDSRAHSLRVSVLDGMGLAFRCCEFSRPDEETLGVERRNISREESGFGRGPKPSFPVSFPFSRAGRGGGLPTLGHRQGKAEGVAPLAPVGELMPVVSPVLTTAVP